MNHLKRLIVEVHRRSLWQVLLIYCGAALAVAKPTSAGWRRSAFNPRKPA